MTRLPWTQAEVVAAFASVGLIVTGLAVAVLSCRGWKWLDR